MSLVAARDILELLELGFPKTELSEVSKRLREQIDESLGWDKRARFKNEQFGQNDMRRQMSSLRPEDIEGDMKALVEAAARLEKPKRRSKPFQTPVFKCFGDYENCLERLADKALPKMKCSTALIICVGKQLIPFANLGG